MWIQFLLVDFSHAVFKLRFKQELSKQKCPFCFNMLRHAGVKNDHAVIDTGLHVHVQLSVPQAASICNCISVHALQNVSMVMQEKCMDPDGRPRQ